MLKNLIGLILIVCCYPLWALVPIEGALLGKVNEDYQPDPLDLVFKPGKQDDYVSQKHELKLYNGFILEGERLASTCSINDKLYYSQSSDSRKALSSVASTLQYLGLDLTTRAIGKYAKTLDFNDTDYENLVGRLVNNYCSKNLSVISLKNLKENLLKRFEADNDYTLPSTSGNQLFPVEMSKYTESLKAREHEFLTTVKLFRAFCSWDGDPYDLRLMTPIAKNPFVMSFVSRLMEGMKLKFDNDKKILGMEKSEGTLKVVCHDLVCRPVKTFEFNRDFPRSIGSPDLRSDLNRLYCSHFRDLDYKVKDQEEHVKKWINEQSLEEEKFAQMHFISLITKIPDFTMGASSYKDFIAVAKLGVDETWTKWAQASNEEFAHELYYEESLQISVVDRSFYYFFLKPEFKVTMDLSLGEFDKTTVINDKIGFNYTLKMNKAYMRWIRNEYMNATSNEAADVVINQMVGHLGPQMNKMNKALKVKPWNEGLSRLVAIELLEQFRLYQGNYFADLDSSEVSIPLDFRYGVFALKYMNYRAKTKTLYEEVKKAEPIESDEPAEQQVRQDKEEHPQS